MASNRKILLDNAWSAWSSAIHYCDLIYSGRSSFHNRKNFVATLHNSVELFLKQIMLDQNDHRVATPKKLDDAACDLAKNYYTSQDLNSFFKSLNSDDLYKFLSIEFNQFYDLHKTILGQFLQHDFSFKAELKLLARLRNDETHFFTDTQSYLTENEFKQLYNFMVTFYEVLGKYRLLPFWGQAFNEDKRLEFQRSKLVSFSYKNAIITSKDILRIKKFADGLEFQNDCPFGSYEIAEAIHYLVPELQSFSFNELWEYVEVLDSMGMIEIMQTESDFVSDSDWEYPDEDDRTTEILNYVLVIDLNK